MATAVQQSGPSSPPRTGVPEPTAMSSLNGPDGDQSVRSRTVSNASPVNQDAAVNLNNPSTFVCNVNRTSGNTPHARIGATTTIVGDVLYVFGGRLLSGRREVLSNSLHTLDLKSRHWKKLQPTGTVPRARYFHSVCALGDEKLICFGGMALKAASDVQEAQTPQQQDPSAPEQLIQQADLVTLSDVYIYDITEEQWHQVKVDRAPQSRYAHLATISPSSTVWTSPKASVSAIHAKQSQSDASLDPAGGAEMIVLGGQNMHHEYIQQLDVFNFRSLSWTKSTPTDKKYGVYRSMAATLVGLSPSQLGCGMPLSSAAQKAVSPVGESDVSTLIYSNYRFTDARLELDIRTPQGNIQEKAMAGETKPPGLRFPTGGILNNHLVVSGTRLHETTHEYAFWALDLSSMTWSRLDVGPGVLSTGSWNRGLLWHRRNAFIILGDRSRDLPTDYKERRVNFTSFCEIQLEVFGFYSNPRTTSPMSDFKSASEPIVLPGHTRTASNLSSVCASTSGGRLHFNAAQELGKLAMGMREFSDMDFLTITGERIPVNSRVVAKRWGPTFNRLLRDGTLASDGDSITLRPGVQAKDRQSLATITPTAPRADQMSISSSSTLIGSTTSLATSLAPTVVPTPDSLSPNLRPRTLYLPHTPITVQALVHYLYTASLPPISSPLGTPQALCSLLQLARPYQVDGLFEAIIERLHLVLDERNAAAIFNAAAMAAGDGSATNPSTDIHSNPRHTIRPSTSQAIDFLHGSSSSSEEGRPPNGLSGASSSLGNSSSVVDDLSSGEVSDTPSRTSSDASENSSREDLSALANAPSAQDAAAASSHPPSRPRTRIRDPDKNTPWTGNRSGVIGIQKRGLRGLMEGRTMREGRGARTGASGGASAANGIAVAAAAAAAGSVLSSGYARPGPTGGAGQEQAALAAAQSVGLGIVGR